MAFVIAVCVCQHSANNDESLSQDFPSQVNEGFTKMNIFVMQQYVYSSE